MRGNFAGFWRDAVYCFTYAVIINCKLLCWIFMTQRFKCPKTCKSKYHQMDVHGVLAASSGLFTNRLRSLSIVQAGKFLWINRQTSKEEQWKNKLFKQKSMTIWAKNFVELRRQKIYILIKKWAEKEVFEKTLNCDLEPGELCFRLLLVKFGSSCFKGVRARRLEVQRTRHGFNLRVK